MSDDDGARPKPFDRVAVDRAPAARTSRIARSPASGSTTVTGVRSRLRTGAHDALVLEQARSVAPGKVAAERRRHRGRDAEAGETDRRDRRRRPGVSCSSRAKRSRPGSGSSSSPSKVRSRKTGPAADDLDAVNGRARRAPRWRPAYASKMRARGVHRRDERVQRERLHRELARPRQRRAIVVRSTSLIVSTSARACPGTSPTASGDGPGAADDARHLDDRPLRRGTAGCSGWPC